MTIWLNGALRNELTLPPTNSGWLMGDGIFESLRTYDGKPFALQAHLDRLRASAEIMGFSIPAIAEISEGVSQLIRATSCLPYGRLRITVLSDGNCLITHIPFEQLKDSLALTTFPFVQSSRRGISGLKTISYAENSLALRRAQAQGFDDVLFVNENGQVVETALANLIWFDGEQWWTPDLDTGCLPGVTRAFLVENFQVKEGSIDSKQLLEMQALAITSSVREIVMVERYESKLFGFSKESQELKDSFHAWILGNLGM